MTNLKQCFWQKIFDARIEYKITRIKKIYKKHKKSQKNAIFFIIFDIFVIFLEIFIKFS